MALRLWTGLLAARLFLVLPSLMCNGLKAPVLIDCVLLPQANITCEWKPGDPQTTHYTLSVQRETDVPWSCTTPNTSCTVGNKDLAVNFEFCINITAHSRHGDVVVSSQPPCQLGVYIAMLAPVNLNSVTSVDGKPQCLTVSWKGKTPLLFPIPDREIGDGPLESQIEFKADGQPGERVSNVTVKSTSFEACIFRPDTLYSVRLRHRYQGGRSTWSHWSNDRPGKTTEDAPSSAPMFWRRVINRDSYRLTSLLWKPLPHDLANGRIVSYNISCVDENAEGLREKGNCTYLDISHTSCILKLPMGPCSCSISASTSVGTSPKASIWLRKAYEKEEVEPFQRYAVSVRALYGKEGGGRSQTKFVYTRQGVPSAGPLVRVQTSGSTVKLSWSLPVEEQRGFIRDYTLFYQTTNQTVKSEPLPGTFEHHSVDSLSPGIYEFWMQASTDAGAGAIGPRTSANIGREESNVVLFSLLPFALISLVLIVMVCVAQNEIVKAFCQEVPDPSHSSVSKWNPETVTGMKFPKPDIKYSDVVLLSDRETENYERYNPFDCKTKYQTGARTTNLADTNFNSCPVIYSNILSNAESASLLELQHHSYPDVRHNKQTQEGVGEQCHYSTEGDFAPFYQMHQPDFACSSFRAASQLHNVDLNSFTSKPLDSFSQIEPMQQNPSFSGLPFPDLLFKDFMDLPQSSMQCDPYLPV
uniref:Fibronectin type-III domain-containing protein n=1 Tax=Neogobius melanostomus TaxID=47308 RepID=A0A8C6WXS5_9GOBI